MTSARIARIHSIAAGPASPTVGEEVPENAVLQLFSRSHPVLEYYLYRPHGQAATGRVLVSVHGVSRNALEHIELFRGLADRHRVMLIAPVFSADAFRDYQRLGRRGSGPRADLALIRVLNELATHPRVDTSKVDLFGFSGGAQFAHRFAYVHGHRVRDIVLGAAGWYTLPDPLLNYPYGVRGAAGLDGVRLNVLALARLRSLVLVGDRDDREDDEELNRTRIVKRTQGRHRVERARRWTDAMNALCELRGLPACAEMRVLPGVGHSFAQAVRDGDLGSQLFEHCYGIYRDDATGDDAGRSGLPDVQSDHQGRAGIGQSA